MRDDDGNPIQELLRNLNTSRIPRIPSRAILIGLLVLIGIIIAWTTFYTVEADEVAVVQRFGRYVRRERQASTPACPWDWRRCAR